MSRPSEPWFIRLPDGRVLRANSTRAVRRYIDSGEIPPGSHARRSPLDVWTPLARLDVFADLVAGGDRPEGGERSGTDAPGSDSWTSVDLQAVGARGPAGELVAALDSSLARRKLRVAGVTGLACGLLVTLYHWLALARPDAPAEWQAVVGSAVALVGLAVVSVGSALLTQMTFIELSRLRPARWEEAVTRLTRNAARLFAAHVLVLGVTGALLYGLARWPDWLATQTEVGWLAGARAEAVSLAAVLRLLGQAVLFPVAAFAWLLAPAVVIGEQGLARTLGVWGGLLRTQPGRLLLHEGLALAVATLVALPFVLTVDAAAWNAPAEGVPAEVVRSLLWPLRGLALTPAFAYLTVANVFLYLHVRYENPAGR